MIYRLLNKELLKGVIVIDHKLLCTHSAFVAFEANVWKIKIIRFTYLGDRPYSKIRTHIYLMATQRLAKYNKEQMYYYLYVFCKLDHDIYS